MIERYVDGGGNIPVRISKDPKQKTRQEIIEEAYRMFPDEVEPVDYHPLGKIVVDRGNLRFAFLEGAQFVTDRKHVWDGPEVVLGPGSFLTCSRCGCDPSDDKAAYKCAGNRETEV